MPTTLKVVVTGPFGAGKTTFINAVSDTPVVNTETGVSDDTADLKTSTTVAMDYGSITLHGDTEHDGVELLFFGTPGQARFEFMWRILAEGTDGYVVLLDARRPESIEQARDILRVFTERDPGLTVVVGAGRTEAGAAGRAQLDQVAATLGLPSSAVFAVDARDADSCRSLLLSLLFAVFGGVTLGNATTLDSAADGEAEPVATTEDGLVAVAAGAA
ncbi:MAG: GTP-binding protein [Dermatophilaceae bacterium]